MNFGRLDRVITLEEAVTSANEFGEPVKTWSAKFANVWASVEDLSGREMFSIRQVHSDVTTRFRIRYIAGVNAKMRIRYRGEIYGITSILNPNDRNMELVILGSKVE